LLDYLFVPITNFNLDEQSTGMPITLFQGFFFVLEFGGTTKTNCSSWHWVIGTKSTCCAFFRMANMHHREAKMNRDEFLAYTRIQDQIDQDLLASGVVKQLRSPNSELTAEELAALECEESSGGASGNSPE
jgi:hypothetical protein